MRARVGAGSGWGRAAAKVAWVTAVASGVAAYGWRRLHPRPRLPTARTEISAEDFAHANQGGRILGRGPDTLVMFLDFRCPYCADLFRRIDSILTADSGALTLRVRQFADVRGDSSGYRAAVAAECAGQQGRFIDYSRWLFGTGGHVSPSALEAGAGAVGVAKDVIFHMCLTSPSALAIVDRDLRAGYALGVRAVPTLLAPGYAVLGTLSAEQVMMLVRNHR